MRAFARLYKISVVIIFVLNLSLLAAIPDANDIGGVIGQSQSVYRNFQKQSFMTRMQAEYTGQFFNDEDKENLRILALEASGELSQLIDKQKKIKKAIEDYSGDDWEQRFGQNKLFRKLVNSISLAEANKLKVDFIRAIASDDYNKNKILKTILKIVEAYPNPPGFIDLIKAKIYATLARVDLAYFDIAKKELANFLPRSDIFQRTAVESSIEYYKLTYHKSENRDGILNFELPPLFINDLELVLPIVFLQRKLNENVFEKAIENHPEIKSILGELILGNLNSSSDFEGITAFEANLGALSAWQDGAQKHGKLLGRLCSAEKFKTPTVLYVSAISCAKDEPKKSVQLLIDASKMQKDGFDKMLNIEAAIIARQGCLLAYQSFAKEKDNKELTSLTFENYFQIADDKVDAKIKYLYCDVLKNLGEKNKSIELLKEISDGDDAEYRCQAKYDLILEQMQNGSKKAAIEKIEELILESRETGEAEIELEATRIYCRSAVKAKKLLSVLADAKVELDNEIIALKAKAFFLADRFIEAMKTVVELDGDCGYQEQVFDILEQVVFYLDKMQYRQEELAELEDNYKKGFEAFEGCFDKTQKSAAKYYLAEISLFCNQNDAVNLVETEKQIYTVFTVSTERFEAVRCYARLMMYQRKFAEAADMWGKFCDISKNMSNISIEKNYAWWQGKYYQLYCFKNSPNAKQSELLHVIEVLERSYPEKEQFWGVKISALK